MGQESPLLPKVGAASQQGAAGRFGLSAHHGSRTVIGLQNPLGVGNGSLRVKKLGVSPLRQAVLLICSFTHSYNQHIAIKYLLTEAGALCGGPGAEVRFNRSSLGQARRVKWVCRTPGKMSNALVS